MVNSKNKSTNISDATIMYVLHMSIWEKKENLECQLYCCSLKSKVREAERTVEKTKRRDEGSRLILQDVVGVDDQNGFFFCACRLWALQPRLRQLDEDVILRKHARYQLCPHLVKYSSRCVWWLKNHVFFFFFCKGRDLHSAPACGWPCLSAPSYWRAPPPIRSLTRSPSGTSSPLRFSSAPPLPRLHRGN